MKLLSRVELFVTPWTVAYQAPPSMGFSRQEYWNGLPFPSPADLPDSGIEPGFPALEADALTSEPPGKHLKGIKLLQIFSSSGQTLGRQVLISSFLELTMWASSDVSYELNKGL